MHEDIIEKHIRGCQQGDRLSQRWVFDRYYRLMFGVCMRYVSDRDAVQDVVQEGFLKVFSGIDRFASKGSFEGCIRRIMVNTAIDHVRKEPLGQTLNEEEYPMHLIEAPAEEEGTLAWEGLSVHDVLAAMEGLTPTYKAVFNMYVFDNLEHAEIAERLGISVGTSKSNLAKARRNMKRILEEIRRERSIAHEGTGTTSETK